MNNTNIEIIATKSINGLEFTCQVSHDNRVNTV